MASMTMALKVDVRVEDGGLAQVYVMSKIHALLIKELEKEEVTNLSDFTCLWTTAKYEEEAKEFCDKIDEIMGKKVEVSRLRAAIQLARAVMERPATAPSGEGPTVDMEAALEPEEKESMLKAWTSRYNITLSMWLDPADPLVNRLWREFRMNTPKLISVNHVKSTYTDNNPNPERKVNLAGGLTVTLEGKDKEEIVRDVSSYYFSLRILANACAKAGNYEVESKVNEGKKTIFAPLDVNLDYADFALRSALKQEHRLGYNLRWLLDRDEYTRGIMINYMRRGYPQGEALAVALDKSELKWASPLEGEKPAQAMSSQDHNRKRERSNAPGNMTQGQPKSKKNKTAVGRTQQNSMQKVRYANIAKGGKTICIGFNKGQCKGDQCQYGYAHVCNIIENGRTCGKSHPAVRHNQGR